MHKAPLALILFFVFFVALGLPEIALAAALLVVAVEGARFAYGGLRPAPVRQRISR